MNVVNETRNCDIFHFLYSILSYRLSSYNNKRCLNIQLLLVIVRRHVDEIRIGEINGYDPFHAKSELFRLILTV